MPKITDLSKVENLVFPYYCKEYKDMCYLLNEKPITNSKKKGKQIARWHRVLVIVKVKYKHEYKIVGIKPFPDEEEETKPNPRNTKYLEDVVTLLKHHIATSEEKFKTSENSLIFDINRTLTSYEIGLCNREFVFSLKREVELGNRKSISKNQSKYFGNYIRRENINPAIKRAIDNLKKDNVILDYEEIYYVREIGRKSVHRPATEEELAEIEKHKKEIDKKIEKLGEAKLNTPRKRSDYHRELNSRLTEAKDSNISYCYKNIRLTINPDYSLDSCKLDGKEKVKLMTELNKLFLSQQKNNARKRFEKNKYKIEEEKKPKSGNRFSPDISNISDSYQYQSDYVERWNIWLDTFIDASNEFEDAREMIGTEDGSVLEEAESWNPEYEQKKLLRFVQAYKISRMIKLEFKPRRKCLTRLRKVLPGLQNVA